MKKKVLSCLFALALLATAGFGVNKSMNSDAKLSDLALANVEALANSEQSTGITCDGVGRVICPLNNQPYYMVKMWG